MKLNIIGLISAIIAFITIILPWYTEPKGTTSLLNFVNITWDLLIPLAFIVVGGLLGLFGSFIVGKRGKNLLMVGMVSIVFSPITFAARIAEAQMPLVDTSGGTYFGLSFGFFLAIAAAILMFISATKHPMEARAFPSTPSTPVVPLHSPPQ